VREGARPALGRVNDGEAMIRGSLRRSNRGCLFAVVPFLAMACSDGDTSATGDDETNARSPKGSASSAGGGGSLDAPAASPGESLAGNSGQGAGGGDVPNADCSDLTHTKVRYCTRASPSCRTAGAGCPLFVVHNTDAPFQWVDDASRGPVVVTKGNGVTDGNAVRHWVGELPLTVMRDYPGIDPKRVFFIGWSAGAGAAYRGMCHASKGNGISAFGNNAEIYAGMVTLGGCPACSESWSPVGRMHTLAINGANDQFASDGCEKALRLMAADHGCTAAPAWANVAPNDPLLPGKGSDVATKLDFGECSGGAVAGYRFRDEGHVLSFKKHFEPKVSAIEMTWRFLQGKRK
jgi:poly(3-hydroxybutyrate) depolymerase